MARFLGIDHGRILLAAIRSSLGVALRHQAAGSGLEVWPAYGGGTRRLSVAPWQPSQECRPERSGLRPEGSGGGGVGPGPSREAVTQACVPEGCTIGITRRRRRRLRRLLAKLLLGHPGALLPPAGLRLVVPRRGEVADCDSTFAAVREIDALQAGFGRCLTADGSRLATWVPWLARQQHRKQRRQPPFGV